MRTAHLRIAGATGNLLSIKVLILDENLLWSQRFKLNVAALGHEPVVQSTAGEPPVAEVAIVNLGSREFPPDEWIPKLKAQGTVVIAHAGHKEKPLLQTGADAGAHLVVTNGEITHKLALVLDRALKVTS